MPEKDVKCPDCGGVGYITGEAGGLGYATPCACLGKRTQIAREHGSCIPERFADASFGNFYPLIDENPVAGKRRATASTMVRSWANEYATNHYAGNDKRGQGLLLIGPPGTGKTHLAVAALKQVISRGLDGIFFDYQSLLTSIARSWNRDAGESERETFRRAVETDLIVIDDLGAQRALEWSEDIITEIVTIRYNSRRAMIVTTNLPDPALHSLVMPGSLGTNPRLARSLAEIVGERTRSRLFEMCRVIDLAAVDDYRMRQKYY